MKNTATPSSLRPLDQLERRRERRRPRRSPARRGFRTALSSRRRRRGCATSRSAGTPASSRARSRRCRARSPGAAPCGARPSSHALASRPRGDVGFVVARVDVRVDLRLHVRQGELRHHRARRCGRARGRGAPGAEQERDDEGGRAMHQQYTSTSPLRIEPVPLGEVADRRAAVHVLALQRPPPHHHRAHVLNAVAERPACGYDRWH